METTSKTDALAYYNTDCIALCNKLDWVWLRKKNSLGCYNTELIMSIKSKSGSNWEWQTL